MVIGYDIIQQLEEKNFKWLRSDDVDPLATVTILEDDEELTQGNTENRDSVRKRNKYKQEVEIAALEDVCGIRPYIAIKVNGRKLEALVDTGAAATLVHARLFTTEQLKEVESSKTTIRSVTGSEVHVKGLILCEFLIMGRKIKHEVHVIEKYRYDCVLGMDLLPKLKGVKIDLETSTLEYDPEKGVRWRDVAIAEETVLPPRSESIIRGQVNEFHLGEVLFEPNETFSAKSGIPITAEICEVDAQEIPVRMVNFSRDEIRLRPGTRIGTIEPIKSMERIERTPTKYYEKIKISGEHLTRRQIEELEMLLEQYDEVLARHEYDFGQTNLVKHKLPLNDEQPIKQRPYRVPYKLQETVKEQVQAMAEQNIIRKSSSPWTSPVVMVKKKDGKMRFCIDYRRLNSVTRKDTYPLPRIDEMLDKLAESTIFTTLDLQSGYWQIEVEESDKPKTAFSTGNDLWEFNVMPFGLTGAPATFQRCMNYILMDSTHAMVYIDDIIIFSKNFEEHLQDIENVFERLLVAGLKIKPTKCDFAKKSVTFLGHIVSAEGIMPDPTNTDKIRRFPRPRNVKEIQQFLGLVGYYRKFIRDFAKIAAPLVKLVKKSEDFRWTEDQQRAFEELRDKLLHPPILRYPNLKKPFLLMTDASGFALGAVLGQQEDNEKDHVIAYASRGLKPHEKNYSTIEKEALAIVFAFKQFRHYVYGQKIVLYTDHKPLVWLMTHKDTSSRLIRWALLLQEYNIEFKYKVGKANANADSLSRIEISSMASQGKTKTVLEVLKRDMKEMEEEQSRDKEIQALILCTQGGIPPRTLENHWKRNKHKYFLKKKTLYYGDENEPMQQALVLPKIHREGILLEYHDGMLGGHLSARKTLRRISKKYYWPNLEEDVKDWCKACQICASRRDTGRKPKVPLKPMPIALAPMEQTAMDIVGPLPLTRSGNKYILVFSDYFTRWPEAYAMEDQKSETVAQIFVEKIVYRYGVPKKLLTDRGANFLGEVLESISKIFKITRIYTSPYHPQTDGLVERFNQTLLKMISCFVNEQQTDWDVYIAPCLFAYRNTVHSSTGATPFYLMYLRESNMPSDIKWTAPITQYQEVPEYKELMMERLHKAWNKAGLKMKYAQEGMKERYDATAKPHEFKKGDKVLINVPQPKKGTTPKLKRPFKGPYVVIETTETNLKVRCLNGKKTEPIIVHANRCKMAPSEKPTHRYKLRSRPEKEEVDVIEVQKKTERRNRCWTNPMSTTMIMMILLCWIIGEVEAGTTTDWLYIVPTENSITFHRRAKNYSAAYITCRTEEYVTSTLMEVKDRETACKHLRPNTVHNVEILLYVTETMNQANLGKGTKMIKENLSIQTMESMEELIDINELVRLAEQSKKTRTSEALIRQSQGVRIEVLSGEIRFIGYKRKSEKEVRIRCRENVMVQQPDHLVQETRIQGGMCMRVCKGLTPNIRYEVNIQRVRLGWDKTGRERELIEDYGWYSMQPPDKQVTKATTIPSTIQPSTTEEESNVDSHRNRHKPVISEGECEQKITEKRQEWQKENQETTCISSNLPSHHWGITQREAILLGAVGLTIICMVTAIICKCWIEGYCRRLIPCGTRRRMRTPPLQPGRLLRTTYPFQELEALRVQYLPPPVPLLPDIQYVPPPSTVSAGYSK